MLHRAQRLPTRVLVQVRAPGGGFDATIGNVSAGGARLVGVPDRMLRVGDHVEICAPGQALLAEVRWHFDDTCGLMFAEPLDDARINALLGARLLH